MIHNLSHQNSILNQFITEIRDVEIQKDSMRFRRNLERIGEIFAYEISKTLPYHEVETTTPLGIADTKVLVEQPVIATILRAGLPLHIGLLNFFDKGQNAFISVVFGFENSSFEKMTGSPFFCGMLNGTISFSNRPDSTALAAFC